MLTSGLFWLWSALTAAAPAAPGPGTSGPVLTLAGAVEQALARNDRIEGLRDSAEQAELGVRLARNSFKPKVTPNINGSFGNSSLSNQTYRVDVSQRFTTGTQLTASLGTATAQNQIGSYYNTDTTLSFTQPLL